MRGVPDEIVARQLALFARIAPAYAAGVAKALGREVHSREVAFAD
jgi:hypothetical protein